MKRILIALVACGLLSGAGLVGTARADHGHHRHHHHGSHHGHGHHHHGHHHHGHWCSHCRCYHAHGHCGYRSGRPIYGVYGGYVPYGAGYSGGWRPYSGAYYRSPGFGLHIGF